MSDARGRALQNALADYIAANGFPHAESAGAGRQGTDVLGTPGLVWECKTARGFKTDFRPKEWVAQSKRHANGSGMLPVTVYFPNGVGAAQAGHALAIVPLHVLMQLLKEAGYTG
jgi:hypothetical protein